MHQKCMARKAMYWGSTVLISAMASLSAAIYLSGSQQAVEGFARVGYPQQLRVLLGIAKPLGAIALLIPGLASIERVGLCRIHLCLDCGDCRALPGWGTRNGG